MKKAIEAILKTPITYYGGKQTMLRHILPKIPQPIDTYVEPYYGGGTVHFAIPPARCEMINDNNHRVINFYKVYKTKFDELWKLVDVSLLSRKQHIDAKAIYQNPEKYTDVELAWAFWFLGTTAFNGDFYGNIKFSRNPERSYKWVRNAKENLKQCVRRLETTQIDCRDALKVVEAMDSLITFFYLDPPYLDADQGHYYGYSRAKFTEQLEQLGGIKGKFLLSCYWGPELEAAIAKYNWNYEKIKKKSSAAACHGQRSAKIEVLTWNYKLSQIGIFH